MRPNNQTAGKRLQKACLIIVFAIIVLVGGSFFWTSSFKASSEKDKATDFETSRISFDLLFGDEVLAEEAYRLPEGFEEEVLDLRVFTQVKVSAGGKVVGFFSSSGAEEAFEQCSKSLGEKGWVCVESGHEYSASFIKGEGKFNWLYLSCVPFEKETSVLIQIG